jgi:hypothetical protein
MILAELVLLMSKGLRKREPDGVRRADRTVMGRVPSSSYQVTSRQTVGRTWKTDRSMQ